MFICCMIAYMPLDDAHSAAGNAEGEQAAAVFAGDLLHDAREHLRRARGQRLAQQIHDRLVDVRDRQVGHERHDEDHRREHRQRQVEAERRGAVPDVVVRHLPPQGGEEAAVERQCVLLR